MIDKAAMVHPNGDRMVDLMKRRAFTDFLERLSAGTLDQGEWGEYAVNHYHDDRLEDIRREVVRMSIEAGSRFLKPTTIALNSVRGRKNSQNDQSHQNNVTIRSIPPGRESYECQDAGAEAFLRGRWFYER